MKHLSEEYKDNPYYKNFVDADELLPCPFCGSPAESLRYTKEDWNTRA